MNSEILNFYFAPITAAFVRGVMKPEQAHKLLFESAFEELIEADYCQLIGIGLASESKIASL
jgi:hypothetical protein